MLHCPATLLVARHGDADYAHAHVMSDDGGWLTDTGREQVTALAQRLHVERVAAVRSSILERAVESAELAGDLLAVAHRPIDGLEEIRVGSCAGKPFSDPDYQSVMTRWFDGDLDARMPGAESGHEVLERFRAALLAIADDYRGETVLVFSHGGIMSFALPRLAGNAANDFAKERFLPNAIPAVVEVGTDAADAGPHGIRIVSWPGSADKGVI